MEVEPSKQVVVAKKIWSIVRIMFLMVRKGISKSRIMMDLHLMLKRGKLATKAITNLMFHSSSSSSTSFSCRSNDAMSFVSPREYEFSCSNSPAFYPFYATNKRKHHHYFRKSARPQYKYDDVSAVSAVQKVLEMLNSGGGSEGGGVEAASPLTLPGFGRSPMGRQLRITDSPFPLKDDGDSVQVDKAAEEFIKKFYKDLKLQKTKSAIESPCYYDGDKWDKTR